jgi:peptidoglycan/xylan/chitin deacetylase (PgdA/CDA1 family)
MISGLRTIALVAGAAALGSAAAEAAPCRNPAAIGVHRVMTVDPRSVPLIGSHDYGATLPLAPGEVVLTFDDGPLAPFTGHVLKALADECVLATFFMVGRQAAANPQVAWQVRAAGHTIGTHTQNHPLHRMSAERAAYEIDAGIVSVGAAFGSQRALAPFFRFPGLFRTVEGEQHLRRRGLMAWSVDADSYDWKKISANHMIAHTLSELEKRRGGILLMHDVQAKTALTLPTLLAEMKKRGYRVVHVVPAGHHPMAELTAPAEPGAPTAPPVLGIDHAEHVSRGRGPFAAAPPPAGPGGGGLFEAIFNASMHR